MVPAERRALTPAPVCLHCRGALQPVDGGLRCPPCGRHYAGHDQWVDFVEPDEVPYYGELPRDEMQALLRRVAAHGFAREVPDLVARYPGLGSLVCSARRADWLCHCYDAAQAQCCVELGSEWAP